MTNGIDYLSDMYHDGYFPNFLVDKVKKVILEAVSQIEELKEQNSPLTEFQNVFDVMTREINELEGEFESNGSEIETVARDSIGITVNEILKFFKIDIDVEEAIRERDW